MLTFTNKSHLSSNYIKRCVYCVQDSWVTAKLQNIYANLDTHYQDWIIEFAHELLAPATAVGLRGQKFDENIAHEMYGSLHEQCEQLTAQAQEFVCTTFGIQREFKIGSASQKKEVFYGSAQTIPCTECNWENYVVTQWAFTEFDYSKKFQAGDFDTPKKWTKIKARPQRGHRCMQKHTYPGFELRPYIHHKTKEWTTDKEALQKLILREGEDSAPGELAQLALTYNDKKKQIGFLKAPRAPLDCFTAGNYPTELVILGTNTFRPSSRMNMFGEGSVPSDHEFLTKEGWKSFANVNETEELLCYNKETEELLWENCKSYEINYTGDMYSLEGTKSGFTFHCTEGHGILRKTNPWANYIKVPAAIAAENYTNLIRRTGIYKANQTNSALQYPKLFAACMADGCKSSSSGYVIRVSREHKIKRLYELQKEYGIDLHIKPEPAENRDGVYAYFTSPKEWPEDYGAWLLTQNQETLNIILQEQVEWDGSAHGRGFRYYTIDKNRADWIATIAHLCGHTATTQYRFGGGKGIGRDGKIIPGAWLYSVYITKKNDTTVLKHHWQTSSVQNKKVYGFYTQSGFYLCKYKSHIFVTGNSNSQNLDKDLDKVLTIPDDGYILCERDLSAAENRLLYYITNDTKAISIMEGELDSHSMTAKMITDILAPGVYDWPDTPKEFKDFAESNSLYGIKFRDFGKKVRHSAERYGQAYTIARSMKCKVKTAEEILAALRAAFPVTFTWLEDFKYSLRYCSDPTYEEPNLLRYGNLITVDLGWGHWSFPILGNPYEDETARKYISSVLQSGVALTCFKGLLNMWYTLDSKNLTRGQGDFEILRNKHDANQYQIRRERFEELEPLAQQCMEFESVLRNGNRFLIPTDLKTKG